MPTPIIRSVTPIEDYELLIAYENGETKKFDVKPFLGLGIFQDLKDRNVFKSVHVSFDTVEWANGADIDPEQLYADSIPFHMKNQSIA